MDYNQSQDEIISIVGIMSVEDKPRLVGLLQSSGSLVTELSTNEELLDATFKAIRDSHKFRNDLKKYLEEISLEMDESGGDDSDYGNYVDSDFFNLPGEAKKKTRAGNALSSIFSQENIAKLGSLGIDALGSKLSNSANKGAGKQAIDYANAQAAAAAAAATASAAETERLKAQKDLGSKSGSKDAKKPLPKWVLPVSIGGGVLIIGTIVFFVMRKKKTV